MHACAIQRPQSRAGHERSRRVQVTSPLSRPRPTQPPPPGDDTLLLSSLGVGTYLGADDEGTDEAQLCALLYSVTHGWNVIDTGGWADGWRDDWCLVWCLGSVFGGARGGAFVHCQHPSRLNESTRPPLKNAASNYRGGRAEATVGRALALLLSGTRMGDFRGGGVMVTRDALFISTKVGFVDPDLRLRAAATPFVAKGSQADVAGPALQRGIGGGRAAAARRRALLEAAEAAGAASSSGGAGAAADAASAATAAATIPDPPALHLKPAEVRRLL
jgi:hypothetical protein